jgi:surfeit locus 1 family protein
MKKRVWPILLTSVIGLAILISLGIWQVQRLHWKQGLIAQIDYRLSEKPLELEQILKVWSGKVDVEFLKVKATGAFDKSQTLKLFISQSGGGWMQIQPFNLNSGESILVARGITNDETTVVPPPSGTVTIEGYLSEHEGLQPTYVPDNQPAANRWYWWDVSELYKTIGTKPYPILHLLTGTPGTEGLAVEPPKANLRNNHLGYAITWFGLAIVLIVMTALFVRARMKDG